MPRRRAPGPPSNPLAGKPGNPGNLLDDTHSNPLNVPLSDPVNKKLQNHAPGMNYPNPHELQLLLNQMDALKNDNEALSASLELVGKVPKISVPCTCTDVEVGSTLLKMNKSARML